MRKLLPLVFIFLFFLALAIIQNCGETRPYDPTVISELTQLKAETLSVYDSYANEEIDQAKVDNVVAKLDAMIAKEKARKNKSDEHIKQLLKIKSIFLRHYETRKMKKLNAKLLGFIKANISEAFDIAINTENLRKKES